MAQQRGDVQVLALDLEGTLISNATSQIARPGLREFLEFCTTAFPRVVIYTAVPEDRFRWIARMLVDEGVAPPGFQELEYVDWDGKTKDLRRIPDADPATAILVDDYGPYVHPGQHGQWVAVRQFEAPYSADDRELYRVGALLKQLAPGRETEDPACGVRLQAAAVPYRTGSSGPEILLVTSVRTGKWILPKGYVDPGYTPPAAAETEALEEGGVTGSVSATPLGSYDYEKGSTRLSVQVFPLEVEQELESWPEARLRRRRWVRPEEAIALVTPPQARTVLERFVDLLERERRSGPERKS